MTSQRQVARILDRLAAHVQPPVWDVTKPRVSKEDLLTLYLEHHRNERGGRMDLTNRPYLMDILLDETAEIAIQKCVQCGITEIAIATSMYESEVGLRVLYVLPSQPARNRFVANRVNKAVARSSYYQSITADNEINSVSLKDVGQGVIHFVGSNTVQEFSEFPADRLIVDEQDLCTPDNLVMAEDRLAVSEYKHILRISNPRANNAPHSIGRYYTASTQAVWQVTCENCNTEQELNWFKHFIHQNEMGGYELLDPDGDAVCTACGQPMDRLGPGRWIKRYPERKVSGYKLSKLFLPTTDIQAVFITFLDAIKDPTRLTVFYASVLGEYYESEVSRITMGLLLACVPEVTLPPEKLLKLDRVAGVDVGSVLHYKISYVTREGVRILYRLGTVPTWDDLAAVLAEAKPSAVVIDAHPELHKAKEFAIASPWNVWLCVFGSDEQTSVFNMNFNKQPPELRGNRTAVFDATYSAIANRQVLLTAEAVNITEFTEQMQAPVRRWEPNAARGQGRYVWVEDGPDHFRLADIYEYLAAQVLDRANIEIKWV